MAKYFSCSISFVIFPFFLIVGLPFPMIFIFSSFINEEHSTDLLYSSFTPSIHLRKTNHLTDRSTPPRVSLDGVLSNSTNKSSTHKVGSSKKERSLKRVEGELAKARAAIREAIQSRNYTSEKKETFIPRGSIYRNPYAFHQSHIEMQKRFKVWTYEEGEQPLVHDAPAHVFFLPISVAKIVAFVYMPITSKADFHRGRPQRIAPDVSAANPEIFKNFIKVLCNANTSEGFQPIRDVSLPEIYLPFGKLRQPIQGQYPTNRRILAFFDGRDHGHMIRKVLLKYWKDKDRDVQVHEFLPSGPNYTKIMGQTKYCLCPSGNYTGCVPVIISDSYCLPFSDVLNRSQFSVQIPAENIPEIKTILQGIPQEKYLKMQKNVVRVQRHFVLNRPAKPFDVIHMVLHSVWLRRLNFALPTSL
ncbi:hypothetical protein I3760_03G240000 [Carya illinoinensis]|nr:hypothetical protein I3760_03G240000 [Carya illinoinensis]